MQTENRAKIVYCSWCKHFCSDRYHKKEGYCDSANFKKNVFAVSGHMDLPITVTIAFGCVFGEEK